MSLAVLDRERRVTYSCCRSESLRNKRFPEQRMWMQPLRSASMHIELPGSVRIRLEGNVDAAMVRAVLKSLRS